LDQFLACFHVARVCQRQLGFLVWYKSRTNSTNLKSLNNLSKWQRSFWTTDVCRRWQLKNSVHIRLFLCHTQTHIHINRSNRIRLAPAAILYTVSQKKTNNYTKLPPNLTIFGTKMANSLKLYEVHSFSTSPNSRQCTTVLNADKIAKKDLRKWRLSPHSIVLKTDEDGTEFTSCYHLTVELVHFRPD